MINIATIYHFSLLQRISEKQKSALLEVCSKIESYLQSENISYTIHTKQVDQYDCTYFKLGKSMGLIQFFHNTQRKRELHYFPYMFCEIYLDETYIKTSDSRKKAIFLLSNIFECFDEFEEKNLMIEFHKDIEESYNNKKQYKLRYDFLNINSLLNTYTEKNISKSLQTFIKKNPQMETMSHIRDNFPEVYKTLLFFVYNVFSLQKSFISTEKQLQEIQKFETLHEKDGHISLSEERLKLNHTSLEKTLNLYKTNFEYFIEVMTQKR